MTAHTPRHVAQEWDAADPLAGLRDRFVVDDPCYLDGNSLGRLPPATGDRLAGLVRDEWGDRLVRGWDRPGSSWPAAIGDRIGAHALGAAPGEVIVSDSTSVNFYKLAAAALDARPGRDTIVTDADNFPTDRYLLEGLAAQRGHDPAAAPRRPRRRARPGHPGGVADRGRGPGRAVAVVVPLGALPTWRRSRPRRTRRRAGAVGPLARGRLGAAGADDAGVDLAVGCTYKYLNGGPGAPAFLYVRRELQEALRQPIWGWFGQRDQFGMGAGYDPAPGPERFLVGTPPVLGMAALDPALDVLADAGTDRVREKSVRLGELIIELADAWLVPHGFRLASPREPGRRGGHVSLHHPEALRISRALVDAGVVGDYRVPDRLRLGPAALYTRYVDVWDAMDRLRDVAERQAWTDVPTEPSRVT